MTPIIQKTPGILGGDARVRNTRIAIWMLVRAKQLVLTDEEILARYPRQLTEADLGAAWDYYRRQPDEIDEAIRENE